MCRLLKERSVESGYMPRNCSELKSGGGGGTIPMLSPHPEKWGDASPPVPHRSTPVLVHIGEGEVGDHAKIRSLR